MSKAKELKSTTAIVKDILEHDPMARNSDDYLYYMVCNRIDGICVQLPFWKVILNRKEYGLPGFETVRRSRQHIQEKNPDLAADSTVEAHRDINEEIFREYARGMA